MAANIDIEALAQSETFRCLSRVELEQVAATMRRRTYRRGAIILHEGDFGESLFVICAGHVKVMSSSETGDLAVLRVLGPGDHFGELALLDGTTRSATIEAVDAVEAAVLTRADLL